MKKFPNLLFAFCGLAMLAACTGKNDEQLPHKRSFGHSVQLQGEAILPNVMAATQVFVMADRLLVKLRKQEHHYAVYRTTDLSPLGYFAKRGEGKGEWQMPVLSRQFEQDSGGIYLWVNEINRRTMYKVNLAQSLAKAENSIVGQVAYPPSPDLGQEVQVAHGALWFAPIGQGDLGPVRFRSFVPQQNTHTDIAPEPSYEAAQALAPEAYYPLFFNSLGISRKHKKIASAMEKFDRIDFYDWNGQLLKSIGGDKNAQEIQIGKPGAEGYQIYYRQLVATDSLVYALHYQQPESEYGEKPIPVHIHVFDWQGKGLYELQIDDYLSSFAVDEQGGWLYGIDFYNEKQLRYKLNLPKQ